MIINHVMYFKLDLNESKNFFIENFFMGWEIRVDVCFKPLTRVRRSLWVIFYANSIQRYGGQISGYHRRQK